MVAFFFDIMVIMTKSKTITKQKKRFTCVFKRYNI